MNRNTRTTALILAMMTLVLLSGVPMTASSAQASGAGDDWLFFKGDAGRSGAGVDGPDGEPITRWRFEAGAPITGNLSVSGGVVFATSDSGVLHAVDLETGVERWRFEPGTLLSPPTVADDSVFVFAGGSDLVALDPSTGDVRWRVDDLVSGPSGPTAAEESLFVGSDDGFLFAIDTADGAVRWVTRVSDAGGAVHSPAYADGRVHVASDGGGYTAVAAADGSIVWRYDTGVFATATAVVVDGIAWIGAGASATEGRLWALDAASGELQWQVDEALHSPSVADSVAFSGSASLGVVAHDARTGRRLWSFPVDGMARPLAVAEGTVYVPADDERRLYALDAAHGTERWHVDLDEGNDCCAAVAGGLVLVGTWAGSLYAIGGSEDQTAVSATSGVSDSTSDPSASGSSALLPNPVSVVATLDPERTSLSDAASLDVGPDGNLYVAETTPRISVVSPDGEPLRSWGSAGAGPGELDFGDAWPSIAVSSDGLVYVTEAGNSRVSVFRSDGTFVRHLGSFGDDPGQFLLPFEVVLDGSGDVYVMDDVQRTVSKFDASGAFVWRLDPHSDADFIGYFHRGGVDSEGHLWLTNDERGVALSFDEAGQKLETFDARAASLPVDLLGPCQIALDAGDNAYVMDCSNRAMQVFDANGRLTGVWIEPDALPFGHGYRFGPDGYLYAVAGGNRAEGGSVSSPDTILVMEVAPQSPA